MIQISVVIITFNEERNLARCLDSVKDVADEIVIVDSCSTDDTAAIASGYNAKVIQHGFIGYGEQKNFAAQQAANNWILSLDADEALTPELTQSILEIKKALGTTFIKCQGLLIIAVNGYGIVAGTLINKPVCLTAQKGIGLKKKCMSIGRHTI